MKTPVAVRDIRHRKWLVFILVIVPLLVAGWYFLPGDSIPDSEALMQLFESVHRQWYFPLLLLAVYCIGGLLLIPVTSLVVTTALIYSPPEAFGLSMLGMALNTTLVYWTGRLFPWRHPRIRSIRRRLARHNIWMIAAIRMIPIAHFTVVSIALGSARVRYRDVLFGTLLGMIPGTLLVTLLTDQTQAVWDHPNPGNLTAEILMILVVIGAAIWIRRRMKRRTKRPDAASS